MVEQFGEAMADRYRTLVTRMVKTMNPYDKDIDWWQRMLTPTDVEPTFYDGLWLPHLIWRWRDLQVAIDMGQPQGVGTWEHVAKLWLNLKRNVDGNLEFYL